MHWHSSGTRTTRGAQAFELPAEAQQQGRALPVRRAPAKARQRKQGKGGRRPHEQQRERLPRQGGKAAQHPFGCRQAGILYGSGQQPRQKQAPDRIPCGRAKSYHNLTFRRDCTINAAACQTVNAPLPPKRKGGAKERKASVWKRQLFILFWKRTSTVAACARVAVPAGSSVVADVPLITPFATAHCMAMYLAAHGGSIRIGAEVGLCAHVKLPVGGVAIQDRCHLLTGDGGIRVEGRLGDAVDDAKFFAANPRRRSSCPLPYP